MNSDKELPTTVPSLSEGALIGVKKSMREHRQRVEVLLSIAEKEEHDYDKFRFRVMAAHFTCAHSEVLLEALKRHQNTKPNEQRKAFENDIESRCPSLTVIQAIRAKDFHQMVIVGGKGYASYGQITLKTNPGKGKQLVMKVGDTGWENVSDATNGKMKVSDHGHDVVQVKDQCVLIGQSWVPLVEAINACLDTVENWRDNDVEIR